jgi:hypothetical protein
MTPIEVTRQMLGHLGLAEHELIQVRDLVDIQADIVVRGFMQRHGEEYERLRNSGNSGRSIQDVSADGLVSDTPQQE